MTAKEWKDKTIKDIATRRKARETMAAGYEIERYMKNKNRYIKSCIGSKY